MQTIANHKKSKFKVLLDKKTLRLQFRTKEGELSEQTAKANTNVAELETQKSNLIRAFSNATIPEVMRGIEDQIKEIQSKIDHAKTERTKMELVEDDLTDFISWCHKIMEHPSKLLTDIGSEQELIATASIFFDELPTYSQILSGTPKLSLFFKLSEEFETDKSRLVTLQGIEPCFQA